MEFSPPDSEGLSPEKHPPRCVFVASEIEDASQPWFFLYRSGKTSVQEAVCQSDGLQGFFERCSADGLNETRDVIVSESFSGQPAVAYLIPDWLSPEETASRVAQNVAQWKMARFGLCYSDTDSVRQHLSGLLGRLLENHNEFSLSLWVRNSDLSTPLSYLLDLKSNSLQTNQDFFIYH